MSQHWTDHLGIVWALPVMQGPLKFKLPSHAAIRAFVFHRDGYKCRRCPARAVNIPDAYDGRYTLFTDTLVRSRKGDRSWSDVLIVDHVLTRRAGGRNHPDNLQTLCETCNKQKQAEDRAATIHAAGIGLL